MTFKDGLNGQKVFHTTIDALENTFLEGGMH